MEKPFRPAPLEVLARWLFRELETQGSAFGIPAANFQQPDPRLASRIFGQTLAAPLGVAAGPNTQLSQNLVAAWLCGARFLELKTIQVKDELEVSRPCIDAADATYNCEWSQELKLEQSYREYLHAWVLIHALAHRLGLREPGVVYSMSVGYDLQGIQSPPVQRFMASMRAAGADLPEAVEAVAKVYPAIRDLPIPGELSNQVTLSTMHGCPPSEIERIARHLLTDLKVHTWVKFNPTLLGPERLRSLLNDQLGFDDIQVPDEAFQHDPSFGEAIAMIRSLARTALGRPEAFGVKLTNTLEVVNHRSVFPSREPRMYLSGRAMHPLALQLAHLVTEALDGAVPISFSGGADAQSFPELVADGLAPVTVCADLLKPGGYARLQPYLTNLEAHMRDLGAGTLEAYIEAVSGGRGARFNLARHAERVVVDGRYARRPRATTFKGSRPLDAFDCISAPCQEACPAHQNIPDYLWLVAHQRPSEALGVILRTNPLPGITGCACDHPCTERCVRQFYEAPLAIREVKRHASEAGTVPREVPGPPLGVRVAIVGAGPGGLSAAYYLRRMGLDVELFEGRDRLGGMVNGVLPGYRIGQNTVATDLDRLAQLGVRVHFGRVLGKDLSLRQLRGEFAYLYLGIGAQKGKALGIPGEEAAGVMEALDFLRRVDPAAPLPLGRHVLVIGGGNSAMDAARSSRRLAPEAEVTIVYRRTREQMPADLAEVQECLEEGIRIQELLAPVRVVTEQGRATGLACTPMRLGEKEASGRLRAVPTGAPEVVLKADTILTAISQEPVLDCLEGLEVRRQPSGLLEVDPLTRETSLPGLFAGGDVVHGAASIIIAIADGRAAAEEMGRRHGLEFPPEPWLDKSSGADLLARKARLLPPRLVPVLPVALRSGFEEVNGPFDAAAAVAEASRCLDCDELCSLCVTVCPNRANVAYATEPLELVFPTLRRKDGQLDGRGTPVRFALRQRVQIVTLGDFCNACGNCDTFCPTAGAPYRDKPHLWLDREGFLESPGDGYHLARRGERLVLEARLGGVQHWLEAGTLTAEYPHGPGARPVPQGYLGDPAGRGPGPAAGGGLRRPGPLRHPGPPAGCGRRSACLGTLRIEHGEAEADAERILALGVVREAVHRPMVPAAGRPAGLPRGPPVAAIPAPASPSSGPSPPRSTGPRTGPSLPGFPARRRVTRS